MSNLKSVHDELRARTCLSRPFAQAIFDAEDNGYEFIFNGIRNSLSNYEPIKNELN